VHPSAPSRPFLFARLAVALGVAALAGCNMSDEAEELSGGYLYRNEGPDTKELLSNRKGMPSIFGRVVRYGYNADFVVAAQRPMYDEYRYGLGADLRSDPRKYPTNSTAEREASERVADSLLAHDPHYRAVFAHGTNYWIIAHGPGKVYGPLTYPEYVQQARALQVPNKLAIEAESE